MPEMKGVVIRRVHILLGRITAPVDIECPDCGRYMFQVVERADGGIKTECTTNKCRDRSGDGKNWIVVLYTNSEEYFKGVKADSTIIDV